MEKVRCVGMVVVECVIFSFEFNGEKLLFEYVEDDEIKLLKFLVKGLFGGNYIGKERKKFGNDVENIVILLYGVICNGILIIEYKVGFIVKNILNIGVDDDIDDDDKFFFYDLNEEDDVGGVFRFFKYLRDCI